MALWGGRFTQAADQRFKQFNDSLRFDYRLAEQDIVGSVAWSKALVTVGVLSADEQLQLEEALNVLLEDVRANPQQILESDAEDIHSWVEGKLIDKVGQLGKKLHTGRSRNDQVATDLKLWCKDTVMELLSANRQLQSALVETAENNQDAVMPGYTHLQRWRVPPMKSIVNSLPAGWASHRRPAIVWTACPIAITYWNCCPMPQSVWSTCRVLLKI